MKRFMKRMGFLMVLVLLSTSYIFSIGVNATDVDEFLIEKYGEEFMANLDQAHENDEALMALFPKNESGEPVYPDFIGGIYYNDDGNMVVQMVTDAQPDDTELLAAVEDFIEERDIIVENVEFSHSEIKATMDTLETLYFADDRPDAFDNVESIAEDTLNNRVEIRMLVYNEEEIARFKETALNSPMIGFVQSSGPNVDYITPIHYFEGGTNNYMGGSVGYRAKLNGVEGFVTHGHGITNGQKVVINGHTYGTVVKQQCSGTVDAAFVQTTSRGKPMNDHTGGKVTTTVRSTFKRGDAICKAGRASSYTVGEVTNPSVIRSGISGLVETDCWAQPGDSGGLVIGENNTTAGIVKGGPSGGGNMYFCRTDAINAKWGLVRY